MRAFTFKCTVEICPWKPGNHHGVNWIYNTTSVACLRMYCCVSVWFTCLLPGSHSYFCLCLQLTKWRSFGFQIELCVDENQHSSPNEILGKVVPLTGLEFWDFFHKIIFHLSFCLAWLITELEQIILMRLISLRDVSGACCTLIAKTNKGFMQKAEN